MITAEFYRFGELLCGFKIFGHSGYADEGEDVVCAAVSSAACMTANTITDVMHVDAQVSEDEEGAVLALSMREEEARRAQDILCGLRLHLTLISKQYKKFIKVNISEV